MKLEKFSSGGILGIIFRNIKESPRTLAELYVYRDRTLVYKWLHDNATPSKALVPGIVAFVLEKTCEPVRLSIRKELGDYISACGLRPEIAAQLTGTEPFPKFIEDMFHVAIAMPAGSATASLTGVDKRGGRSVTLAELGLVLLAVLGSGIAWNVINRVLGWTYYMGGEGREPRGIAAAVWGLTASLPIIIAVSLSRSGGGGPATTVRQPRAVVVSALYSLAGMIGAVVFYDTGVRAWIEGFQFTYTKQELAIGFTFATLVSLLPLGVVVMSGRIAGKRGPGALTVLAYALLPSAMVCAAVWFTFFVDRPITELEQLRGFLAGFMLRTGMYLAARRYSFNADSMATPGK